mgnify:CR=1 FL=1
MTSKSKQAFLELYQSGKLNSDRLRIYHLIKIQPQTLRSLQLKLNKPRDSFSSRLSELADMGLIKEFGSVGAYTKYRAVECPHVQEILAKIHPTQKPVKLLQNLISIFTDENDVVIDPCAGSGSTLLASVQLNRKAYGFEIKKDFYKKANEQVLKFIEKKLFV